MISLKNPCAAVPSGTRSKTAFKLPGHGSVGRAAAAFVHCPRRGHEPEVLLMDEPCSALDPIATAQVEELIDELRKNYSVVIVTHSMQQAARVSQKTAFFPPRASGGIRRNGHDFHQSRRSTHRKLYHWPDRLRSTSCKTNTSHRPLTAI